MAENRKISVLDLSKPATFNLDAAARQFSLATRECGFIYVRMDNRAKDYISSLREQQRLFFAQSQGLKEAIAIDQNNRGYLGMGKAKMHGAKRTDQKEVFFWGREAGPVQIIAHSLDAPSTFFRSRYDRTMLRGQLLCYPPCCDDAEQFGVAPHSDFGCITLLLQETAGLEVQFPDGEWVAAPPVEDTLVMIQTRQQLSTRWICYPGKKLSIHR